MKTYAIETYGLTRGSIICGNMVMLRKAVYGKVARIKPAPKRQRLIEYGGDMTIEKFRENADVDICLLYTSPSPRDLSTSRMPSSA